MYRRALLANEPITTAQACCSSANRGAASAAVAKVLAEASRAIAAAALNDFGRIRDPAAQSHIPLRLMMADEEGPNMRCLLLATARDQTGCKV